jgi:Transposase DDE domain
MDDVVAKHGIQVLIPPDSGKRKGERPGWTGGRYSFMRRVLGSDHGRATYRKRQQSIEPVYGHTKHNRKIYRFNCRGRNAVRTEWLSDHDPQPDQAAQASTRRCGGLNRPRHGHSARLSGRVTSDAYTPALAARPERPLGDSHRATRDSGRSGARSNRRGRKAGPCDLLTQALCSAPAPPSSYRSPSVSRARALRRSSRLRWPRDPIVTPYRQPQAHVRHRRYETRLPECWTDRSLAPTRLRTQGQVPRVGACCR